LESDEVCALVKFQSLKYLALPRRSYNSIVADIEKLTSGWMKEFETRQPGIRAKQDGVLTYVGFILDCESQRWYSPKAHQDRNEISKILQEGLKSLFRRLKF